MNPNYQGTPNAEPMTRVAMAGPIASAPQKASGSNAAAIAGAAVGGAALGIGGVALASAAIPDNTDAAAESAHPLVDAHISVATTVNDNMTFSQAFAAARAEVGAGGCFEWHGQLYGTYYKTEWDSMTAAQKAEYNDHFAWSKNFHGNDHVHTTTVVNADGTGTNPMVDGDVAVATAPAEGMSFEDAFAAARAQVGPGGVFEWHGKLYNTYYKNEWDNMSAQERAEFNGNFTFPRDIDGGATAEVIDIDGGVTDEGIFVIEPEVEIIDSNETIVDMTGEGGEQAQLINVIEDEPIEFEEDMNFSTDDNFDDNFDSSSDMAGDFDLGSGDDMFSGDEIM